MCWQADFILVIDDLDSCWVIYTQRHPHLSVVLYERIWNNECFSFSVNISPYHGVKSAQRQIRQITMGQLRMFWKLSKSTINNVLTQNSCFIVNITYFTFQISVLHLPASWPEFTTKYRYIWLCDCVTVWIESVLCTIIVPNLTCRVIYCENINTCFENIYKIWKSKA